MTHAETIIRNIGFLSSVLENLSELHRVCDAGDAAAMDRSAMSLVHLVEGIGLKRCQDLSGELKLLYNLRDEVGFEAACARLRGEDADGD